MSADAGTDTNANVIAANIAFQPDTTPLLIGIPPVEVGQITR
jgi:hypothetical protein